MSNERDQALSPVLKWLKSNGATIYGQGVVDPPRQKAAKANLLALGVVQRVAKDDFIAGFVGMFLDAAHHAVEDRIRKRGDDDAE